MMLRGRKVPLDAEARCLCAIRAGASSKSRIAITARLSLLQVVRALDLLVENGLAIRDQARRSWSLTTAGHRIIHGGNHRIISQVQSDVPEPDAGTTANAFLQLLDRPRRAGDLAGQLGVTRQYVHNLMVQHLAAGRIRVADETNTGLMIARSDDPTILLRKQEERVLSALPDVEAEGVTVTQINRVLAMRREQIETSLSGLVLKGLVSMQGTGSQAEYWLTPSGATHCQRRADARRAAWSFPRESFRSDRLRSVLAHLAAHGPARSVDISRILGIPFQSMNALMQYLKRRGLASKTGEEKTAPYEITSQGRTVLSALQLRVGGPDITAVSRARENHPVAWSGRGAGR
jgi:predicted transcriptional regulator